MADHAGQWRTIRLLLLRRIHQRDARRVRGAGRGRGEASEGFVLLFVVLATLLMTVGTLAMTNRSTMGLMGSLFQGVGIDAQEAAEIGVNRIISELNRAPNRGLLRSKGSTVETALWTLQDASSFHKSRCPGVAASDLASNANFGNASGRSTTYNTVYVQDDGSISATANGARRAYRLVSVTRRPESELTIFQSISEPAGTVILEVEGRSLRPDGSTIAISNLRRTFRLIPRCCGTSFGGVWGNVSYARPASDSTPYVCLTSAMMGLGLVGGTGSTTGTFNLTGSNAITMDQIGGTPVTPVYCLADSSGNCNRSATVNQGISIDLINPRPTNFPAAKTAPATTTTDGNLSKPKWNVSSNSEFAYCLTSEASTDPIDITNNNGKRCRTWAVNSDANSNKLPSYCVQTSTETSCSLASLDYTNTDVVFLTNTRALRIYFTQPGSVLIGGNGNRGLHHCNTFDSNTLACTGALPSTSDLAMFGCNSCGVQSFELKGTPDVINFFVYVPNGTVALNGTPTFMGVLWTNTIQSSGNVNWVVPGAGLRDVLNYMGLLADRGSSPTANPLLFDYVARATSSNRWINQ